MRVSLIVAYDNRGVIGRNGKLPWHLPKDLARFKALTMGKPIIMGRRTFESIGRPLPGRTNIVMTHGNGPKMDGIYLVESLNEALGLARATGADEAMIIGGAKVYEQALPLAQRVYATEVESDVEGDVWFPRLDPNEWTPIEKENVPADEHNELAHLFVIYERKPTEHS